MKYFEKMAKSQTRYYVSADNPKSSYTGFAKEKERSDRVVKNLSKDFSNIKREKITAANKGDMQSYLQGRIRVDRLSKLKGAVEKRPTPTKLEGAAKSGLGGAILGGLVGAGIRANVGAKASRVLKGLGVGAAVGAATGAPVGIYGSVKSKKKKERGLASIQTHIDRNKRLQSLSDVKIEKI